MTTVANPAINSGDAAGDSYVSIRRLTDSRFADTLTGNDLNNRLTGNAGADVLTGGAGRDRFAFNTITDSPPGAARDKITDFDAGTAATVVDQIDLSAIDAETGPGNQAFTFIGTAAFTHTRGELRVRNAGTSAIVAGDKNGDGAADFEIELLNFKPATLRASDFVR